MNCQSFGNVVVDLARSQPLEAGVRDEALAHRSGCDNCARRFEEEKMLTVGLRALVTEMKSATAPRHLEQNLISALREQKFVPLTSRAANRWRYLAVAAAIVIAVTVAVAGLRMRQSPPVESQAQSSPPVQIETPETTPPRIEQPAKATQVQKRTPQVAANHRARKRRSNEPMRPTFVSVVVGAVTDPNTPEVASPFMPLGYTNAANIQEGAQVVRVELPRYAMARFGLPVNMERYDERVKADVWLGADGLARAIRFVQ
jgi:hypothetical protein